MAGKHSRTTEIEELSEATAISREIVAVRARRAQIESALEIVPSDLTEAVEVLEAAHHELGDRLGQLQEMFTDPNPDDIPDPEDGPPADRSLIPPL